MHAFHHYRRFTLTTVATCSTLAILAGVTPSTAHAATSAGAPAGTTYTIVQDGTVLQGGKVLADGTALHAEAPVSKDTKAPITLPNLGEKIVVAAGKKTAPANLALAQQQPGYNTYQKLAPEGDAPDFTDLDLTAGYSADKLFTLYHADIPENLSYTLEISGFDAYMNNPRVAKANDQLVLTINNNASNTQIQRAIVDSDDENLATMSDALGTHLGKIYRDLYTSGKLVKLQQLVGGNLSRAFHITNATAVEKAYYHAARPFARFPQNIKYYYEDMEDYTTNSGYAGLAWSYPSGHTNRAYIKGIVLAAIFPEFAPQLMVRASEVGYNRIVMGVHYPLDTVAGRITASASMAWHFSDPRFYPLITEAARDTRAKVEKACGTTIMKCWKKGSPYLSDSESVRIYTQRMNYNLPRIGAAGEKMVVPQGATTLLKTAFPKLTDAQREYILKLSAMDSGYPLDITGPQGYWQRINLAKAFAAQVKTLPNGALQVTFPV